MFNFANFRAIKWNKNSLNFAPIHKRVQRWTIIFTDNQNMRKPGSHRFRQAPLASFESFLRWRIAFFSFLWVFPQLGDGWAGDWDEGAEGASLELQQQQHQPSATAAAATAAESVCDGGGKNHGRALAQSWLFPDDEETAKLRDLSSEFCWQANKCHVTLPNAHKKVVKTSSFQFRSNAN